MRYIRIMHFLFVSALALVDLVFTGAVSNLLGTSVYFVSNLAFLGIVLLIQNDNNKESFIKTTLLALWMDLNHVHTFPIFFVSYMITMAIMRLWQRQITSSFWEFSVIAIVSLFIKDTIQYLMIVQTLDINMSYQLYLAYRILPTVLGNLVLLYPLLLFYKKIHHIILANTQDLRSH